MPKHVRYGLEIRTAQGQIISSVDMTTEAVDELDREAIEAQLVSHLHSDMCAAPGGLWDIGPAQSTHSGVGGMANTIVNVRHVESLAVWIEIQDPAAAPKHAAAPVSTWDSGADLEKLPVD